MAIFCGCVMCMQTMYNLIFSIVFAKGKQWEWRSGLRPNAKSLSASDQVCEYLESLLIMKERKLMFNSIVRDCRQLKIRAISALMLFDSLRTARMAIPSVSRFSSCNP